MIEDDEYFEESRDTEDRECSQCIDIPSVDIHGEKPPPMKKPAEKNLIKKSLRPLTVPHMNILIMAVGTRWVENQLIFVHNFDISPQR